MKNPMSIIALVLVWLGLINFAAYSAIGTDKARATGDGRRIPESNLLLLALLGGTIGAFAGRKAFRHKTRKQPFTLQLQAIATLQLVAIVAAIGWLLMD